MGLHSATVKILENKQLCEKIVTCLMENNYSKVYVQDKYQVTRHEIRRILETYNKKIT